MGAGITFLSSSPFELLTSELPCCCNASLRSTMIYPLAPSSPGVSGIAPGIGATSYEGLDDVGGRDCVAGSCVARGLVAVGCSASFACPLKVLPIGGRRWDVFLPLFGDDGDEVLDLRCLNRSSVSRRRASRASSSLLWDDTAFFLLCQSVMIGLGCHLQPL